MEYLANLLAIFTYQFMKTQILSRIQSYQNIPTTSTGSLKKITFTQNNNHTELRQKNKNGNSHDDDPYQSAKFLIPSIKMSSQKLFQSSTTLDPLKKLNNNSNQKQVKKQMNLKYKSLQKNRENRLYKIEKKMSTDFKKQPTSQTQLNALPQLTKKTSKIHNSANKTQAYKTISNPRINGTKTIGSENLIKFAVESQTPEKNQVKNQPINLLMKTVNLFKDYKQSPYFAFSNKKADNSKHDKSRPVRSLYRMSTEDINQKQEDVSIEISVQNLPTQQKERLKIENQNDNIEFQCSEIQQKSIENDSSFLDASQKDFIKQISMMSHKEETKKRIWKKLPSDFLKF